MASILINSVVISALQGPQLFLHGLQRRLSDLNWNVTQQHENVDNSNDEYFFTVKQRLATFLCT